MTNEKIQRIHKVYGIILSAVTVIAGLCLMAACLSIYRSGEEPFSRASVAAAFSTIAIPVYLCLALVVGGFILDLFLPAQQNRSPVQRQDGLILQRLQEKRDLSQCDTALRSAVMAQRSSRRLHRTVSAVLLVLGSIIFLGYCLQKGSFHQSEINSSMIRAVSLLIPCIGVPFAYSVFAAYHRKRSIRREIDLLKKAPASAAAPEVSQKPNRERLFLILRCTVLVVCIASLVFGFLTGGTADVLTKAVNICTECVGLG